MTRRLAILVSMLLAMGAWLSAQELKPTLVFSQIADGGGIRFELNLANSGHQTDSGTVFFRSGEGEPLELLIGGTGRSSISYAVPSGGAIRIESDGEGTPKTGYAVVQSDLSDSKITGTITYTLGGREVSVPSSPLSSQYHTYVERTSGANSGIAFANPGSNTVEIEASLLRSDGSVLDEKQITLEPGHQLPLFINEIFDGVGTNFQGSLHARSQGSFALVGLRQRTSGSLAILSGSTKAFTGSGPPTNPPVESRTSPRTVAVFPQIADGGGFVSEIFLTNSGVTEDRGKILIRDGQGNPLTLLIGGVSRNSIAYTLPPGGALKIETDGAGKTPKTGYVLVETNGGEAAISGSIVYSFSGFEVSVPNSPPTDESHFLVEKTSSANSGVAVANLATGPLSIDVFVLDEEGDQVDEATIELEGGQHRAQFISEIFDGLPADLLGSFHARSSDAFAILGLRQKSSGSLATLSGASGTAVLSGTLVGPGGGQISSPGGDLTLTIPSGALAESTRIEILETRGTPDSLASGAPMNKAWKLKPDGLVLASPAEVRWDYGDAVGSVPQTGPLGMLQWNTRATSSRVIPVTNNASQDRLEFEVDKLENLASTNNPSEMWSAYNVSWEQNATLNWYLEEGTLTAANVSDALDQWENAGSNVRFSRVSSSSDAQLVFRDVGEVSSLGSGSGCQTGWKLRDGEYGVTCFPFSLPTDGMRKTLADQDRVVVEVATESIDQASNPASLLSSTLLHEIGHALGLAHPWKTAGGAAPVMANGSGTTTLQPWDTQALQCHYGLSAQELTVRFEARVSDIDDTAGFLGVSVGQTFQGSFRYQAPATDSDPDPGRGVFRNLSGMTLEVGPNRIEITPETVPGPFLKVEKGLSADSSQAPTDYLEILASTFEGATILYTDGPNLGLSAEDGELFMYLEDSDAKAFDCDRPLILPETGWDDTFFELFFFVPDYAFVEATIVSLEVTASPLGQ